MSLHKSLKTDLWKRKRNVRKRQERIRDLINNYKWKKGMSVYGLPKEKIVRLRLKPKKEIEEKKEIPLVSIDEYKPDRTRKQSRDVGKIK